MEYVILGLLMHTQQTIYSINKMFQDIISLFYHASYGSLQTSLKKLEHKAWITSSYVTESGRNKRYYHITELGKKSFYEWMKSDFHEIKPSLFYTKIFFMGYMDDHMTRINIVKNMYDLVKESYEQLAILNHTVPTVAPDVRLQPLLDSQLRMLDLGMKSTHVEMIWLETWLKGLMKGEPS